MIYQIVNIFYTHFNAIDTVDAMEKSCTSW